MEIALHLKALKKMLDQNKMRFQKVERRAVDVINVITGTGLKYEESEVEFDVCQAILEMRMEAEKIGEQKGEQIGALKKARESAERFYKMGMEVEKVAEGLGCDVETVREWLKLTV